MADPLGNAIAPQAAQAPGATPGADPGYESRYNSWMTHLQSPETRAALLQFGIGMLQPRQAGQTFMGQVGTSMGDAGQAAARVGETQRLVAKDQREQTRLDQQTRMQNEQLAIDKENLGLAKGKATREEAQAAANAQQQTIDNSFKERELALKGQSQRALETYYKALGGAAGGGKKTLPAGYQEALDVAKTAAGLEDDPIAAFFAAKAQIDTQYGLTAAPQTGNTAAGPTATAAPALPKPGDVVDGWKFKGGDPSKQTSWEKVK